MNTEFIYFVAPRGTGKTSWLCERALQESVENAQIYLLVKDTLPGFGSLEYRKFMDLFYSNFSTIATIHAVDKVETIPEGAVVLIDDPINHSLDVRELYWLKGKVSKVYITMEGTPWVNDSTVFNTDNMTHNFTPEQFEQLSIFSDYKVSI